MNLRNATLPLAALVLGCVTKDPHTDWDTGSDYSGGGWGGGSGPGGGSGSGAASASFNIAWTDDGNTLEASVSNGHNDGYFLGLAETGAGAAGWYGEDCVSDGSHCHMMTSADSLTLNSVHPEAGGGGIGDVAAGSTTLFHAGLWAGVTYAFFSNEGAGDYGTVAQSGGDDSSYYE